MTTFWASISQFTPTSRDLIPRRICSNDPFTLFSYLTGLTDRIEFSPQHQPTNVVPAGGTVDNFEITRQNMTYRANHCIVSCVKGCKPPFFAPMTTNGDILTMAISFGPRRWAIYGELTVADQPGRDQ